MVILFNKWFKKLVFVAVVAILTSASAINAVHPYHVSATEMEYNFKEKRIEISTKIFTDDFEAVLTKIYKVKANFSNATMKKHMDELVIKYITTHLSIRSGGKLLPVQLFGWEADQEAIIVYTTANANNFNTKNITVENTVLYDLFDDQMNIVHFLVNGQRKSAKLNYPERKLQFSF